MDKVDKDPSPMVTVPRVFLAPSGCWALVHTPVTVAGVKRVGWLMREWVVRAKVMQPSESHCEDSSFYSKYNGMLFGVLSRRVA